MKFTKVVRANLSDQELRDEVLMLSGALDKGMQELKSYLSNALKFKDNIHALQNSLEVLNSLYDNELKQLFDIAKGRK